MKISELIKELEALKKEVGDVPVFYYEDNIIVEVLNVFKSDEPFVIRLTGYPVIVELQ